MGKNRFAETPYCKSRPCVTEDPDWVSDHESQLLGERMPPTVLVIDPDETTRAQLGRILTAEGYQVLEARSGADGSVVCASTGPH